MTDLCTKIICSVPVDGKSHKGRMFVSAFKEIWEYDRCTRILVERVGVDAFVKALTPLIPKTLQGYCNDGSYETEWRRAIWAAAWNAWQARKKEEWVTDRTI